MKTLTIKIPLPTLRDPPSPFILILLQHANLLQRLHHLAIDAPARIDMVGWARAAVLGAPVGFAQAAHPDSFTEVDVAGYGCGAGVEPVIVRFVGRKGEVEGKGMLGVTWGRGGEKGGGGEQDTSLEIVEEVLSSVMS